jgi:hypothetical protein
MEYLSLGDRACCVLSRSTFGQIKFLREGSLIHIDLASQVSLKKIAIPSWIEIYRGLHPTGDK